MSILIENEFHVDAPVEEVWNHILDVKRIAPCMPGGHLTDVVDDENFKGKVAVKLGPVSLSFAGTVTVAERNDAEHRIVLKAQGMEQRGKGSASAMVTAWAEAKDGGTQVKYSQDITVTGAVAQFSRGMMQDVSARLTKQFADCLKANLSAEQEARAAASASTTPAGGGEPVATAAAGSGTEESPSAAGGPPPTAPASRPPVAARPVGGIRLALWAFWRAVVRFFRRLFGRGESDSA
jgi:carbon monoxide dehydrogenase subunit G